MGKDTSHSTPSPDTDAAGPQGDAPAADGGAGPTAEVPTPETPAAGAPAAEIPAPALDGSRLVSVDRIRYLLKTARHTPGPDGPTTKYVPATGTPDGDATGSRPTANDDSDGPQALAPADGDPAAAAPTRPPAPSARRLAGETGPPSPPSPTARSTDATISKPRPHPRPAAAGPAIGRQRGPSWFTAQPEMRWFGPDQPDDPTAELEEETYFAESDQPLPADDSGSAKAAAPRQSDLPAIQTDVAEMLSKRRAGGNEHSAEPSSWFTQQPEYQRLLEQEQREQEAQRASLLIPRWLIGLAAILMTTIGIAVFAPALVTPLIEAGQRLAATIIAGSDQALDQTELRIEPLASSKPGGIEPAAGSNQRAPTAPTGAAPAASVGQVTILSKRPPQAKLPGDQQSPLAEPANDLSVAIPPPTAKPASSSTSTTDTTNTNANGTRESVFAPSSPHTPPPSVETPATQNRDEPPVDPFATFSSDNPPQPPDQAPDRAPDSIPEPQAALSPPLKPGLGLETIAGGVAVENPGIAAALEQARVLFRQRDLQGAGKILRDIIATNPRNIDALRTYGDVLILDRRLEPALEVFNAILAISPNDTTTLINRGTTLIALGKPAEARIDAEAVLALTPDTTIATGLRSKANAALGDMAQAMTDCDRIGALKASKSAVEWCRAAAQNHSGNHFVAVRMFTAALSSGEQSFVRAKQVYLRDLRLYDGAIDGIASQRLVDAMTACAVAKDCVL